MNYYFFQLFMIFFVYLICRFYNHWRQGTVLIKIGNKLSKVLGFIKKGNESSIFSIIVCFFAHISLILYIALVIFVLITRIDINNTYILFRIWYLLFGSVCGIGLAAEMPMLMKRAKKTGDKISLGFAMVFLVFGTIYLLYMTVGDIITCVQNNLLGV